MAKSNIKKTNAFNLGKELDSKDVKTKINSIKTKITEQTGESGDYDIESKLVALYALQLVDSKIDEIRTLRGELPLEVESLKQEVDRMTEKLAATSEDKALIANSIQTKKQEIVNSKDEKKRLEDQMNIVKNNRQYDALYKEIEYQDLLTQRNEMLIEKTEKQLIDKEGEEDKLRAILSVKVELLKAKESELNTIIEETEKEETALLKVSADHRSKIENRLIAIYDKLRSKANNGLAVAHIERHACSGCYNQIPAQHQEELKIHKKIIYCEYCRRILVDDSITSQVK
jgi:predicted  nucleic acid-binding Zn-ribbon protein